MTDLLIQPGMAAPVGSGTVDSPYVFTGDFTNVKAQGPVFAQLLGISASRVDVLRGADVTFAGPCHVEGWTGNGVAVHEGSSARFNGGAKLTVQGPGLGYGIHIFAHSRFITYEPDVDIEVRDCRYGFQMGLSALFQHRGANGSVKCVNAARPPLESAAVQGTDHSSWSTTNPFTAQNFHYGFDLNSISYAEATGPRNFVNVISQRRASQNSVVWW